MAGPTSPPQRRMRPVPPNCFREEFVECLHSPFWRSLKVFVFQISPWSLNCEPVPPSAEHIERSVMRKLIRFVSALIASCFVVPLNAQFADSIVNYRPGTGLTPGYTNATAALGSPSRQTVDPDPTFGGTFPVDPFSPPYLSSQLVSIGAGGSLTVSFAVPIPNDPSHPLGLDFIIFGNSGFMITNGDFAGGGVTDGSLFGNNGGATRVSVSLDNATYYTLNPALSPTVDGLFPPDGSGDFQRPVDPSLNTAAFAGQGLTGIRALYNGSGGGSGFDLAWAQDGSGNSVNLPSVKFIRVDVLSGKSEID